MIIIRRIAHKGNKRNYHLSKTMLQNTLFSSIIHKVPVQTLKKIPLLDSEENN